MNILAEAREILGDSLSLEPVKEASPENEDAQVKNEVIEENSREEEAVTGGGESNEHEPDEGYQEEEAVVETVENSGEPDKYTVSSLAEAIGFEPKELYESLEISLDDNQAPIPLGELKNKHQDLVREHKNTQDELARAQSEVNSVQSNTPSREMMQIETYVNQLNQEENKIDWADLEAVDPGQAALERSKYQQKRQQAQNAYNQLQAQENQATTNHRNEESKKILEAIPSWSDSAVRAKDQGEMMNYMKSVGFNETEVNEFVDHRVYKMMKEIIDLRKMKSLADDAVKQVRKAPKMIKNSRKSPPINKSKAADNLAAKARKSRNKNDQLAAAKALFSGM